MQTLTRAREDTIRPEHPLRRRLWHALAIHPAGQVGVLTLVAGLVPAGRALIGPAGALAGVIAWVRFVMWFCDVTPRED